jgi:uncharacterized membrane protein (Fun14 family)
MRHPLRRLLLRLLVLFPACIAAWWLLGEVQVDIVAQLTDRVISRLYSFANFTVTTENLGIAYRFQAFADGPQSLLAMEPLFNLRGLPLYLALMLAAPNASQQGWRILGGGLILFVGAVAGFSLEAAIRIVAALAEAGVNLFDVSQLAEQAARTAAFIQILTKAIVTRMLPIGLWLWQQWPFVRNVITGD